MDDDSWELCTDGITAPAPPCAPYCERACGPCCCYKFAGVGCPSLSAQKYRAPIFVTLSFLSLFQLAIAVVACFGLSDKASTLRAVPWSHIELSSSSINSTVDVYLGLSNVLIEYEDIEEVMEWEEFCNHTNPNADSSSGCQDCSDNSEVFFTTVIATTLSKVGQLTTDLTRSNGKEDVACQKVFGALVPIVGVITSIWALQAYGEACHDNIPDQIFGASVHPSHGIGFIFEVMATVMGIIDIFFNFVVPLPQKGDDNFNYYRAKESGYLNMNSDGITESPNNNMVL